MAMAWPGSPYGASGLPMLTMVIKWRKWHKWCHGRQWCQWIANDVIGANENNCGNCANVGNGANRTLNIVTMGANDVIVADRSPLSPLNHHCHYFRHFGTLSF